MLVTESERHEAANILSARGIEGSDQKASLDALFDTLTYVSYPTFIAIIKNKRNKLTDEAFIAWVRERYGSNLCRAVSALSA